MSGGAGQALLAIAAWPLRRHRPERLALARLYRELAAAARVPKGAGAGPPAAEALGAVRATLYGLGHDHGPSVEAYRVLLDEAERIRREIVVVVAAAERLAAVGNPILAGLVRGAVAATASVLTEVSDALEHGRSIRSGVLGPARTDIEHAIDRLESSGAAPAELTRRAAATRLRALAGQLRAVVESSRTGASEGGRQELWHERGADVWRDPMAILRANLTPDSAVLRHALRAAVLVGGSDLVVRLLGFERGYWVSLTVLVVLRPDFGATLQRSVMRSIGTVIGLILATEILHALPSGQWWPVALIAVFAFAMRLAGPGNVALSAVGLSGLVVALLTLNGVAARTAVVDRTLGTVTGGALAVLASLLLLPAWERRFVPQRLAALLGAYRDYLLVVADLHAPRAQLQRARSASRVARTNAQASVDRARSEPVRGHEQVELGRMVLAHTHRFIHAALTIDAVRVRVRDAGGLPELDAVLGGAAEVLGVARDSVAVSRAPGPLPRLRPLQDALATALAAEPGRAGGAETATTLVDATDRITNSLDTLVAELRRQLAIPSTV